MKRISSKKVLALSLGCLIISQATQAFTCPALTRHNLSEACRTKNLQYLGKQAGYTKEEEVTFVNVENCSTMDALRSMKVGKDDPIEGKYEEKSHIIEHSLKITQGTCTYKIPRFVHKGGKDVIFSVQTKQKKLVGGVATSPMAKSEAPSIGKEEVVNPQPHKEHKSIQERMKKAAKGLQEKVNPPKPPAAPPAPPTGKENIKVGSESTHPQLGYAQKQQQRFGVVNPD